MYSTCLFCHSSLGHNDAVEAFRVGRRLAFDAAKGRLWVVCAKCGRWNLTPLEERWEAIEQCERLFRDTRARASTEEIGLTRLRDGTDLVRIGRPLRPEFAAWRYGVALVGRRRRDIAGGVLAGVGGTVGVFGASAALAMVTPFLFPAPPLAFIAGAVAISRRQLKRVVARVPGEGGATAVVRAQHLAALRLRDPTDAGTPRVVTESDAGPAAVVGADAARLMTLACVRRNQVGATQHAVRDAVARVEELGGAEGVLRAAARAGSLARVGYIERLGLEMALHEEMERRALESELRELEHAWREAEEIAGIADDLLLPASVREFMGRHRREQEGRGE
jgi:hypothetical protein